MYSTGCFRLGATRTDEQQAEREEKHSKHKQRYSGFDHFQCKMTNLGKRCALFVGTPANDGTAANYDEQRTSTIVGGGDEC